MKPIKKEKEQKNKSQRGDIIFEKIEANGLLDFDDSNIDCPPITAINKFMNTNFTQSQCEWLTHKDLKDIIVTYINNQIHSNGLSFSVIFEKGIELGWDIKAMDETLEMIPPILMKAKNLFQLSQSEICSICQEEKEEFYSLECSHKFCLECFKSYLRVLLSENGPSIVKSTCPMKDCKTIISFDCYEQLFESNSEEIQKYHIFLQNFLLATKESKKIRQCPFENCSYLCKIGKIKLVKSIICPLGHGFCLKCFKMPHPLMISCNKLKFLNSTSSYGLSNSWIASNTKRCPKCKSSIEKNQGCDHMTCKYCGNQFCWLCLSQYYGHSIGDSFCQTSAKIALENQVKRKEKAELYCSYLDNFSKISEKYVEKNNNIEKKKMHLLEKLKSQSHKFDVKIKKNAENFGIYIFEIEKNLAYSNEHIKLLNKSNINLEIIVKDLENFLRYFTESIYGLSEKSGLYGYYQKIHLNNYAIQKFLQLNEAEEKLRSFYEKIWNF